METDWSWPLSYVTHLREMLPHSADGVVDGVEIFEDCRPGLNGLGNSVLKVCHSDPYISQALLYNSEVVAELVDSILETDL